MLLRTIGLTLSLLLCVSESLVAAEVGSPVDVAPQASETRHQTWPSVAWCDGAKCWLVAWREGYLNEQASDIWCARISAEGKALDAKGIRLTDGSTVNDRPRVASDGKSFLVVWETLRRSSGSAKGRGPDWDVAAARISADGRADKGLLAIAGGYHNQCRPDVAFAKGNYFVAWMGYENGAYGIQGALVSPDGAKLDSKPVEIARFDLKLLGNFANASQALLPVLAANREGDLLSAFHADSMHYFRYLARRPIDAATGRPRGPHPLPRPAESEKIVPGSGGGAYGSRALALALGPDSGLLVSGSRGGQPQKVLTIYRLAKTGEALHSQELGSSLVLGSSPLQSRAAVAFAGKSYLVVTDCLSPHGGDSNRNIPPTLYSRILGWQLSAEGKVLTDNGFVIAGTNTHECLLPAAAAGPEGVCLVVYSEVRGVDNVKVVARIVK